MVRAFSDNDFKEVQSWGLHRKIHIDARAQLPENGFIIKGVAAGFLYCTDSAVAILGGYIANPLIEPKPRGIALDKITKELLKLAKSLGYTEIKCDTNIDAVKQRALKHGFKSIGMFESFLMEI